MTTPLKNIALACALIGATLPGAVQAATVYAQSVVDFVPGSGVRSPLGNSGADDGAAALGAPDADNGFVSLGFGGHIVLDFGQSFSAGHTLSLFETTFRCAGSIGHGCTNWPEAADVYTGSGWRAGVSQYSDFTLQGRVYNDTAQHGVTIPVTGGGFSQILIVDRAEDLPDYERTGVGNAGFDLDAVGVAAVPVPATLPLMLGVAGVFVLHLRRGRG